MITTRTQSFDLPPIAARARMFTALPRIRPQSTYSGKCRHTRNLLMLALLTGVGFVGACDAASFERNYRRPSNDGISPAKSQQSIHSEKADIANTYGKLPLSFEANEGQFDGTVRFSARAMGYRIFLTSQEVVLSLQGQPKPDVGSQSDSNNGVVRMRFLGAKTPATIEGRQPQEHRSNYFIGNDPHAFCHRCPQLCTSEL